MVVKTEWTLRKWHLWLAVFALVFTVLSSLLGVMQTYTVDSASMHRAVENGADATGNNTARINMLERARTLDHNLLIELKVNMKHQMRAQGLEYQEVSP